MLFVWHPSTKIVFACYQLNNLFIYLSLVSRLSFHFPIQVMYLFKHQLYVYSVLQFNNFGHACPFTTHLFNDVCMHVALGHFPHSIYICKLFNYHNNIYSSNLSSFNHLNIMYVMCQYPIVIEFYQYCMQETKTWKMTKLFQPELNRSSGHAPITTPVSVFSQF